MDTKKIGGFLKELRKEKGLTQEQLAEILFVSGRTISRWETGTNMPDLSILIQLAEFYNIEMKEILDGERKSERMDKELKETLLKAADYSRLEKEKAVHIGSTAFVLTFAACVAIIVVQLIVVGELRVVAGETLTLLVGGMTYIGMMLYHGIWESGSRIQSAPAKDALISVVCAGIFSVVLILTYLHLGAKLSKTMCIAAIYFVGIAILSFGVLRMLAYGNKKQVNKKTVSKGK